MFSGTTLAGGSSGGTFDGLGIPFIGTGGDDETMGYIDWNGIINQAFGIGSQAISAFSGRNTGTQIGYNQQSGSVFAITPSRSNFDDPIGGYQPQTYTPQQYAAMQQQAGVGGTVGSGVDGIFNWLMSNPLITLGGIAALYLLFKEPPRRR